MVNIFLAGPSVYRWTCFPCHPGDYMFIKTLYQKLEHLKSRSLSHGVSQLDGNSLWKRLANNHEAPCFLSTLQIRWAFIAVRFLSPFPPLVSFGHWRTTWNWYCFHLSAPSDFVLRRVYWIGRKKYASAFMCPYAPRISNLDAKDPDALLIFPVPLGSKECRALLEPGNYSYKNGQMHVSLDQKAKCYKLLYFPVRLMSADEWQQLNQLLWIVRMDKILFPPIYEDTFSPWS